MAKKKDVSIYISYLLRHDPMAVGLDMDARGYVSVEKLIEGINSAGVYTINREQLEKIVREDSKGRYRFSDDGFMIKACQGHSVPWVVPEMEYIEPPEYLYHGTTAAALDKIKNSGAILKMSRHAVHMQAQLEKAWQSAVRWHQKPVVLKIAALKLYKEGTVFGRTENDVWCAETIPASYITEEIYEV